LDRQRKKLAKRAWEAKADRYVRQPRPEDADEDQRHPDGTFGPPPPLPRSRYCIAFVSFPRACPLTQLNTIHDELTVLLNHRV
jgi:hypothetical protein